MDYEPGNWVRASDIFLQVHIQLLSMDSLAMNLVRAETFFNFFFLNGAEYLGAGGNFFLFYFCIKFEILVRVETFFIYLFCIKFEILVRVKKKNIFYFAPV